MIQIDKKFAYIFVILTATMLLITGSFLIFKSSAYLSRDKIVTTRTNKNTEISETTKTDEDSEMPSESIEVGDGSVTIQIRDSNCKVKLIEDVIMLLDVNNNATVYYQDTGVKTSETSDVYESYLYSWACDSGTLISNESKSTDKSETSEEDTEDEFVDENITSMTLGDKTISFFYRF